MRMSIESIGKIVEYYKAFGPMLKMGAADPQRPDLYGMHIGYQDENFLNESASKLMERKIIEEADIRGGYRILDAGCGMGTLVFEIADLYPNSSVHGIELLNEHVSVAGRHKAEASNVFFSRQDYLNLAFRDNSFDRILFSESLVHAQDKKKLLSEAHRVLRSEGRIVIADTFTVGNLTEAEISNLSAFSEETGIPKFENLDSIIEILQDLGFKNIVAQDITLNLVSTIPLGLDIEDPSQSISLADLEKTLSIVGELLGRGKAAYFILRADAQK